MLIFWTFYYLISFLISFSFYKLFSSRVVGLLIAVFIFGLLSGIWFIYPGSQELAPIVSIFFLENTIVESNGYLRLFRPLLISLSVGLFFGLVFIFFKKKLGIKKRKD